MSRTARSGGFTLVEVLVALATVSIALVAGLRATQALTGTAQRQADVVLAQLCADNELTRLRLLGQAPPIGDADLPCAQAGRNLVVALSVKPTPNPNFRKVDARVSEGGIALLAVSTVVGL
jgi:general secretion pathway protein I